MSAISGDVDSSIVNPAKLSPWLALNICMYCHEQGDARVLIPVKALPISGPALPWRKLWRSSFR